MSVEVTNSFTYSFQEKNILSKKILRKPKSKNKFIGKINPYNRNYIYSKNDLYIKMIDPFKFSGFKSK